MFKIMKQKAILTKTNKDEIKMQDRIIHVLEDEIHKIIKN